MHPQPAAGPGSREHGSPFSGSGAASDGPCAGERPFLTPRQLLGQGQGLPLSFPRLYHCFTPARKQARLQVGRAGLGLAFLPDIKQLQQMKERNLSLFLGITTPECFLLSVFPLWQRQGCGQGGFLSPGTPRVSLALCKPQRAACKCKSLPKRPSRRACRRCLRHRI